MTIKHICDIGKIYRLYKLILPTGVIYSIEALNDDVWRIIDSTADTGLLANRMIKWGLASDRDQALRLLNR